MIRWRQESRTVFVFVVCTRAGALARVGVEAVGKEKRLSIVLIKTYCTGNCIRAMTASNILLAFLNARAVDEDIDDGNKGLEEVSVTSFRKRKASTHAACHELTK